MMWITLQLSLLMLAASCFADGPWKPIDKELFVGSSPDLGNGYFYMPNTSDQALLFGWVIPPEENGTLYEGVYEVFCETNDPTMCLLFRDEDLQGFQIGIKEEYLNDSIAYDYIQQESTFVHTTRFGMSVYVITIYTVDPKEGVNDPDNPVALWIGHGPGKEKTMISKRMDKWESEGWVRQDCVQYMGVNYYLFGGRENCELLVPISLLVTDGQLNGIGMTVFGNAGKGHEWFEPVTACDFEERAPDAPKCMIGKASQAGLIELHVFFFKDGLIKC